jgi:hypothetical protein
MRLCLAKAIVDQTRATNARSAVEQSLATMLERTTQTGGAIVVAPDGSFALARTTRTMTWASVSDPSDARSGS